jgi:hypothetical protein
MKRAILSSAAAFGVAVLGTAAVADLPNDRWSYDDPVVTGGEWEKVGDPYKKNPNANAEFQDWERTVTTTEQALNPAERPVGTDRFDNVSEETQTGTRKVNAADPSSEWQGGDNDD